MKVRMEVRRKTRGRRFGKTRRQKENMKSFARLVAEGDLFSDRAKLEPGGIMETKTRTRDDEERE